LFFIKTTRHRRPSDGNLQSRIMAYPPQLAEIVDLFDALSDEEKRDNLIAYADRAPHCSPRDDERFDLTDVRKDEECTDTVGVYLRVEPAGRAAHFRVSLGPHVQTLTKAMTAILCQGLTGATPEAILDVPQDFVPKIVGGQLVRLRSQTVYYILTRMKSACKVWLNRERAAAPLAN
jgi:cysteine desulfuration protein SufE